MNNMHYSREKIKTKGNNRNREWSAVYNEERDRQTCQTMRNRKIVTSESIIYKLLS